MAAPDRGPARTLPPVTTTALPDFRPDPAYDRRFLEAMADDAAAEQERHITERSDWSFHDILTRDAIAERATEPPVDSPREVQAIFLGNLAVEKGHAEYDRILAEQFERHPVFRAWKNTWVAEEEPHSAAMLEWAKVSGFFGRDRDDGRIDLGAVHRTISGFIRNGLTLTFPDCAVALAYPAFQEPATRVTHFEVKQRLPSEERLGRRVLSKIIADEERHERFYCNMVRRALHSGDRAVSSHQLRGVAVAALGFAMPGIETDIPGGDELTLAYRRTGAFTASKVAGEVIRPLISGEGVHGWAIADLDDLDDAGRAAQDALVGLDRDLAAVEGSERRTLIVLARARAALAA